MDSLKEWVRGLVLLVLLASCLELLLPMNGMKKYVRMVMGLVIVLAIARPIFGFLGRPMSLETALIAPAADNRLPTLPEIMSQGQAFREKNRSLAVGEAGAGLAAEAERAARAVTGVADAQASVDLDESGGQVKLQKVTVTIDPGKPGRVQRVEPVRPVAPVGGRHQPGAGGTPGATHEPTPEEQALLTAVRREVAARLGLAPDSPAVRVFIRQISESQRR